MNRISRMRRKMKENPEGALALLDMIHQVDVRETVIEICNDDNLSPAEKADIVLVYLEIPMDKVLDDPEIKALKKRVEKYDNWTERRE